MRTHGAAFGHAVLTAVRSVAVWLNRVTCITSAGEATVLGAPRVKRSAVAVAAPPASKTLPVPTTVAVNRRRPIESLFPPVLPTGVVGVALSQTSQVSSAVVFAQLLPPAISTW